MKKALYSLLILIIALQATTGCSEKQAPQAPAAGASPKSKVVKELTPEERAAQYDKEEREKLAKIYDLGSADLLEKRLVELARLYRRSEMKRVQVPVEAPKRDAKDLDGIAEDYLDGTAEMREAQSAFHQELDLFAADVTREVSGNVGKIDSFLGLAIAKGMSLIGFDNPFAREGFSEIWTRRKAVLAHLVSSSDVEAYNELVGSLLGVYLSAPQEREFVYKILATIDLNMQSEFDRVEHTPIIKNILDGASDAWLIYTMGRVGVSVAAQTRVGSKLLNSRGLSRLYNGIGLRGKISLQGVPKLTAEQERQLLKTQEKLEGFTARVKGAEGVAPEKQRWRDIAWRQMKQGAKEYFLIAGPIGMAVAGWTSMNDRIGRRVKVRPLLLLEQIQRGAVLYLEDDVIEYTKRALKHVEGTFTGDSIRGTSVLPAEISKKGEKWMNELFVLNLEGAVLRRYLEHLEERAPQYIEKVERQDPLAEAYGGEVPDTAGQSQNEVRRAGQAQDYLSRLPKLKDQYEKLMKDLIEHTKKERALDGGKGHFDGQDQSYEPVSLKSIEGRLVRVQKLVGGALKVAIQAHTAPTP